MYMYFTITPFNFCHSHLFNPKRYVSGIILRMRMVAREKDGNVDNFPMSDTMIAEISTMKEI